MLDQVGADGVTEDHVEHPGRHAGLLGGTDDCGGHALGGGHMAAVRLEHHRAAGGQGRSGVATGGGERQGEVAGTEHRHWTDADAVLAQVRARQRLALGQRAVDARTVKVAATQHLGEQAKLPAGATALALNASSRQGGLAAHQGDEILAQAIDLASDGLKELGAPGGRQATVGWVGRGGGFGGRIHLGRGRLTKDVGQRLAGAGIEAVKSYIAQRAARCTDETLS
ncbi:hypothetical protein D9M69_468480 [compost metagenome]